MIPIRYTRKGLRHAAGREREGGMEGEERGREK